MVQLIRPVRTATDTPTDVVIGPLLHWNILVAMDHARRTPHTRYRVAAKGWGQPARVVAPMFDYAPLNVYLPYEFMY